MVLLLKTLFQNYEKLTTWGDPRLEPYPLMGSPSFPILILVSYISFIFKYGPKFMKSRDPYNLKRTIMIYNLVQVFSNSVGFMCGLYFIPHMSLLCTPMDISTTIKARLELTLHYLYFVYKVVDLLDTVFFVLRKKYNQITFLHVYHHVTMLIGAWITCKYWPGGQLYFLGMANTFVHAVMYFYYFLTSLDAKYKNSLWWKKHLTQLQILQHCFIFVSFLVPLLNKKCAYPKFILGLYLIPVALMIILFTDFYLKTYVRKRKPLEA